MLFRGFPAGLEGAILKLTKSGNRRMKRRTGWIFEVKLFRLLAINLAIGVCAALLMTGGLLALNPYGLRGLLLADPAGGIVIALMLFGFIVTLGSAAMGTAIMAIGRDSEPRNGKRARVASEPAPVKVAAR